MDRHPLDGGGRAARAARRRLREQADAAARARRSDAAAADPLVRKVLETLPGLPQIVAVRALEPGACRRREPPPRAGDDDAVDDEIGYARRESVDATTTL